MGVFCPSLTKVVAFGGLLALVGWELLMLRLLSKADDRVLRT